MPVPRTLALRSFSFAAFASIVVVTACDSADHEDRACLNIPANGCTLDSPQACDDPTCAAVYQCNTDGSWTLSQTCPNFHAPADGGADSAGDGAADAAPGRDAAFPYPIPPGAYGGPNCIDLEEPDCPVGTIVACSDSVDPCCGCETLFVCQGDEWVTWGECEDDGGILNNGK